jgi:hypothetical protein
MTLTSAENTAPATITASGKNACAPTSADQRVEPRRPLTIGFHVVPLDRRGRPLYETAFTATGRNISNGGLCITHLAPMEYPRALITAMGSATEQFRMEAEVAWTGPTANGVYATGFKVTRKIIY